MEVHFYWRTFVIIRFCYTTQAKYFFKVAARQHTLRWPTGNTVVGIFSGHGWRRYYLLKMSMFMFTTYFLFRYVQQAR